MKKNYTTHILILGAGPCGLGAAWQLQQLGQSWLLCEATNQPGGLATSITDHNGFIWDLGGHVLHSHYALFDLVINQVLGRNQTKHRRQAWVWLQDRLIPYPLQQNLHHLPLVTRLVSLVEIIFRKLICIVWPKPSLPLSTSPKTNFLTWLQQQYGSTLVKLFFQPYNAKIWAYPLAKMSCLWVSQRIAPLTLQNLWQNLVLRKNQTSWGPNSQFIFPAKGGTGAIWQKLAKQLPTENQKYGQIATQINLQQKTVKFKSGLTVKYEHLISTLPLNTLLKLAGKSAHQITKNWSQKTLTQTFHASSVRVVGIGLTGQPLSHLTKAGWIYFPEPELPFYRVTIFSNYAASHVPHPDKQWSVLCEVSGSKSQPKYLDLTVEVLISKVIEGLVAAKIISSPTQVCHTWHQDLPMGYPTPTLNRDVVLNPLLKKLAQYQVYSRGRFGAWKYEVSNMDHSFMQGVETVNWLVTGQPETTVWHPEKVNQSSKP